jgi:hypothetical protein
MPPYSGPPVSKLLILKEKWWWTQSASNPSLRISLFNRENTGNFALFGAILPAYGRENAGFPRHLLLQQWAAYQGIFTALSGNSVSVSGK